MALLKYRRVLQSSFSPKDEYWNYQVDDLPHHSICDKAGFIKTLTLVSNSTSQGLLLSLSKVQPNRALSGQPLHLFIHFTCSDFRLRLDDGTPATFRESSEYLVRLLKSGVHLNETYYHFYGHSNSQLKSKSCILMAGSKEMVNRHVENLGDFTTMKTVAKKAKRIGLLFSTARGVLDVDPARCRDIEDIENEGYVFTDGCGLISPVLSKVLAQKMSITHRNRRYHPSVFQIRYRGYKGVPYTFGYLNDEIVLLLHSLGISQEILLQKQLEHCDSLNQARSDARIAFKLLTSLGQHVLAERLLLEGSDKIKNSISKIIEAEYAKMLNKHSEQKCRIFIPSSRLLFGICDPRGVLKQGECFIKITHDNDGIAHVIANAYVLVARNPCLHPGDIQKLRAVDRVELQHLTDCIVFPVQGKRPAADMMSGGDLDGDTFFVCWDSDLVPTTISQPAEYPGAKEPINFKSITHDDRIEYFVRHSSMQLGQVKKLYLRWARYLGPLSSQCQELNRLFSQCVDANKIKIPERLQSLPPEDEKNAEPFILDELHQAAQDYRNRRRTSVGHGEDLSLEVLQELLEEPYLMTQFELAILLLKWCKTHNAFFEDFWLYLDPHQMSSEERSWLLAQLPLTIAPPSLIMNDLTSSAILSTNELQSFGLDRAAIRWRCVFSSSIERLGSLLDTAGRTFPFFTKKLFVLKVSDRFSIAIYLPHKIEKHDEHPLGKSARIFAVPHTRGSATAHRRMVPTKHNSTLYYDDSTLQLYEGKRGNTFVFLTRSQTDKRLNRSSMGRGEHARLQEQLRQEGEHQDWKMSIALGKFSAEVATQVGKLLREGVFAAEIYVISNTDTRSLRQLDLWLEQVDTNKIHMNFENANKETYEISTITKIDWSTQNEQMTAILRDKKLHVIQDVRDHTQMSRILEVLWQTSSHDLAHQIYSSYIQMLGSITNEYMRVDVLKKMLDFLDYIPSLVIHFYRLAPWIDLCSELVRLLQDNVQILLKALILCTNKMGNLVVSPLRTILMEAPEIDVESLQEMMELIALVLPSSALAMELLLDGFEFTATRLSSGTLPGASYIQRSLRGIALDHIEEASEIASNSGGKYHWKFPDPVQVTTDGVFLRAEHRIDAPATTKIATGDHVRFKLINKPSNLTLLHPVTFDAIAEKVQIGEMTFRCLRHPPAYIQQGTWDMQNCGSFVTSKTMIEAVITMASKKTACCEVFNHLFKGGLSATYTKLHIPSHGHGLNECQLKAVKTSLNNPLTCIWGPPGTGKTRTITVILQDLVRISGQKRLLITAPTHQAVDNVMRQYIRFFGSQDEQHAMVRVSTDVRKVSEDLRRYTCDAMVGKDINQFPAARRKAQEQISQARLVFTTCIGAGIGLLRQEVFDIVIIDEASQQTEPASLVPLTKGCSKAILVGDHVQLRATVRTYAQTQDFDVSLFERLWTGVGGESSAKRIMLNTQYRMHPSVCSLPSKEFYEGKLLSAEHCKDIPLPASAFDWASRCVFIQVSSSEDLGQKSKSNTGQTKVCKEVLAKLCTKPTPSSVQDPKQPPTSIAILTPYTRQVEALKRACHSSSSDTTISISSIDSFQGQEADIVIYVTVRCNEHGEIGFLNDMRRLNVALTRAKAGVILIGDKRTLTKQKETEPSCETWERLIDSSKTVKWEGG